MESPLSRRTSSSSSAVNYPFPSEVNVANFVPLKLGSPSDYFVWKQLMLNLIESHQLEGFVDGTIQPPPFPLEEQKQEEYRSWKRSDGLVRGWIFVTVTEEMLRQLVAFATAREAWIALIPPAPSLPQSTHGPGERATMIVYRYLPLYRAIRNGDWENATNFFEQEPDGVRDVMTFYSATALMLAVRSSKRNNFVKKLLERMSPEDVARTDEFGQTALHKALESGNNVAAKLLVEKNPELPNILDEYGDKSRELAVHYAAWRGNREMVDYLLKVTKLDGDPNPFEGQLGGQLLNNLIYAELYDIALTFLQCYPKLASIKFKPHSLMEVSHRLTSFRSGTRLNFFQRIIYSGIPLKLEGNANQPVRRDVENSAEGVVSPLNYC